MAPKLPPPANTNAVFADPVWSDTDKAGVAPSHPARRPCAVRRFESGYNSGGAGDANSIVSSTSGADTLPGRSAAPLRCTADPGSTVAQRQEGPGSAAGTR